MVDAVGESDGYESPINNSIKLQTNLRAISIIPSVSNMNLEPIKTFTENASRIIRAGAETVHYALDALECSTRLSTIEEKSHLELEFSRHLIATFGNFDRFLIKPIEGAGSSVCVAIGVVFIITVILKRHRQNFKGYFLLENGVEPVLQALFGLLSITYRNIGILKILQEFTGRELHNCKFIS